MDLFVGLLIGLVATSAVVVPVILALVRRAAASAGTEELEWELHSLGEEQRRLGEELLSRLHEANRAHLDHERVRAGTELDGKKALIDQQLDTMTKELNKVGDLVRGLDSERRTAFGELTNELQRQHEGLNALTENTRQLREALASQKVRGQWGERMADDVLRISGFLEGVNYRRQATLPGTGGRPDYTFLMPNDLVLHMDVKFPLDNYLRFLDAKSELEQRRYREQFLKDVRDRVRELTGRGYLDARAETVDCLLLFIPNEQVYAFVQEHDRALLDEALRHKVVLCSPLTLYAVLAVVRQAVDNFRLAKASNEILRLLGEFATQWEKYVTQLDKVKQRFDAVGKEYDTLMSTRHRALQRQLDKIDALRRDDLAFADTDPPPIALPG
jgi:DNA recombination protein RmuC